MTHRREWGCCEEHDAAARDEMGVARTASVEELAAVVWQPRTPWRCATCGEPSRSVKHTECLARRYFEQIQR